MARPADGLGGWGVANGHIEPWGEFGQGWERVAYSGRIGTPYVQARQAIPSGWTGSTKGTVTGAAVVVELDSVSDLARYRGKLKGAVVLLQPEPRIGEEGTAPASRTSLDDLRGPPPDRPAGRVDETRGTRVGDGVEVLARLADGRIVAARQGRLLATCFHPELTDDRRFHALFVSTVAEAAQTEAA